MGWICIGLAILCLNYGFVRTILNGQINLVVLLLILLAGSTAGQRRWALLTGLALAGAILLKTYPVVLLALFVLRRDWRVVGACLGGVAAVTLASAAFVPATAWSGWLHNVVPTGGWGTPVFMLFEPSHYANLSLNGLLSRLLDSGTVGLLAFPLTALVLGVTFAVLWRLRDLEARAFHDWAFPITLVATFLVAPLSWYHHAVFLLPGLLLLVGEAAKRQGMPSACLVGIVLLNSFYWSPIARQVEWVSTIPALGVVALWVALLVVADRSLATTWAASVHPDGHVAGRDL
jgi:alpha-1,2-mannosyltransferase